MKATKIYKDENGPKIIIKQLPDKKLPQIFIENGNEAELIATFKDEKKAEQFISTLEKILC